MIAELYLNMCGTELWNRARLHRYMSNGVKPPRVDLKCSPCEGLEDLIPCIEDSTPIHDSPLANGYQLPELDPAPWYDPAAPESMNFAGLLVTETVLSTAIDRRLVQNMSHGATLTTTRFQGRTLTVKGWLIGKTCCATSYGLKWLQQALLGSYCGACDGCALTFLTCQPSAVESECLMVYEEDGSHVPYFRETPDDEPTRGTDFVRQLFDTGLLSGPTIVDRRSGGSCGSCGCAALTQIEFTFGIGNPWLHEVEEAVVTDQLLATCDAATCRITFEGSDDCDPLNPCKTLGSACDDDPDCLEPPIPPPYGRLPLQECGCLPFLTERSCAAVPAGREWFDQALVIEVHAGSEPLRNLVILLWQNPLGLECCDTANQAYFTDCNSCGSLLVGYIPAYGTLRFDSVTREVTTTCQNVTRPAMKNVGTLVGLPFEWFEVGCQPVCLGFDVDCGNTAPDATVSIWRIGREL